MAPPPCRRPSVGPEPTWWAARRLSLAPAARAEGDAHGAICAEPHDRQDPRSARSPGDRLRWAPARAPPRRDGVRRGRGRAGHGHTRARSATGDVAVARVVRAEPGRAGVPLGAP